MNPLRLACVSFLNTKPLIAGLSSDPTVALSFDVPSQLLDRLSTHQADVALLPTIDYQALPGLRVIPSGGIGCDGPTLTVRLFAHVPIAEVKRVVCDTDSHTSVALARILFAHHFHAAPEFVSMRQTAERKAERKAERDVEREDDRAALLLIGDKVINNAPTGYAFQADLGEAWKQMTGLPFVFAIWTARPDIELGDLPQKLTKARILGVATARDIVARHAAPLGWPEDIAMAYLTEYLRYDIGEPQLRAIRMFHQYAAELGLLRGPLQPLRLVQR